MSMPPPHDEAMPPPTIVKAKKKRTPAEKEAKRQRLDDKLQRKLQEATDRSAAAAAAVAAAEAATATAAAAATTASAAAIAVAAASAPTRSTGSAESARPPAGATGTPPTHIADPDEFFESPSRYSYSLDDANDHPNVAASPKKRVRVNRTGAKKRGKRVLRQGLGPLFDIADGMNAGGGQPNGTWRDVAGPWSTILHLFIFLISKRDR